MVAPVVASTTPDRATDAPTRPRPGPWLVALAVAAAVAGAWAAQRWSATLPFGSDNDEYRLVAEELAATGRPVVAGVEGTKYPIGYPLVLAALGAVGLPVTRAALVLNLGLVVGLAAAVVGAARAVTAVTARPMATVPAAAYAVGGAGLWGSVFVTMPDLAFVVLAGGVLWRTARLVTRGEVGIVVGLVVAATLLKSVGLVMAVAASAAVFVATPALRRLAWAPAAAATAVTVGLALLGRPYPEHTTGYGRTFLLVDPVDAQAGRAGLVDLLARLPDRAHLVLRDLEVALAGPQLARPLAITLVVALLGAGVWATWGSVTQRTFAVATLVTWLPAMALWPYSSVRFQLPLLPLAALGVAGLAALAVRRAGPAGATGLLLAVAVFLWSSAGQVRREGDFEEATLGAVAADTDVATDWAEANIPEGDVVASFAYREVAYRLDRPVAPLGYTSDVEALLADADEAGARWLVVMPPLYSARGRLEEAFVAAFPERLRLAHDTPTVDTYQLLRP